MLKMVAVLECDTCGRQVEAKQRNERADDEAVRCDAERILKKIREFEPDMFGRREIMRYCQTFKSADAVQKALDCLEDCGYIRRVDMEASVKRRRGGQFSQRYAVNELVWKEPRIPKRGNAPAGWIVKDNGFCICDVCAKKLYGKER